MIITLRIKCKNCGGAFIYKINPSSFEREERFAISCPYCENHFHKVIENGILKDEENASPYFKNLKPKKITGKPWMSLDTNLKED